MTQRLKRQLIYAAVLAVVAFGLLIALSLLSPPDFHSPLVFLISMAFSIFIITWGFPAPYVGHTSLDRVVQIGAILIFGPVEAAWINALASLVWPLLDRKHNQGSWARGLMRALHNSGMFILMVFGGGLLYGQLGGEIPLRELTGRTVLLIALMAVVMQAINEFFIAIITYLDGMDIRKSFSPSSALVEIASVPLGVATALFYNLLPADIFLLFLGLIIVIVVIVKRFADMREALESRVEELVAVNRIGRAVNASLILDDLAEVIYQECRKLFKFSAFYLVLYDEAKQELDFRLHHNEQGRQPRKRKKVGEGALGWIIAHNKPILIENWQAVDREVKRQAVIVGEEPQSFLAVPVSFGDRVLGAISIQSFVPNTFNKYDLDLLQTFAGQVAVAVANARLYTELEEYKHQLEFKVDERTRELNQQKEELRQLSESLREANNDKERLLTQLEKQTKEDSLTGLFNRRYMDNRLLAELRRAERFGHPVCVAMADIDHFKNVNDNLSHMVGDDVLRVIADLLRKQCRAIDVISRYGGEEFLLYFPETTLENSRTVCEKIRSAIENYDWSWLHPELRVTISIGIADAPPDYSEEKLLSMADAKLYEAKRSGRNRVCT